MSKIFRDEVNADSILQRMWENQKFCDVGLIAGIEEIRIPAHRSVLCAASEYFDEMFTPPFNESAAREVKMPSVDGEILKTLVKYCYMRSIEIREDNIEKLLDAANFLRFGFVVNACGIFLSDQLQPTNCLGFVLLAEQHQIHSLLKKAKDYCLKHFDDLYKTDEFMSLSAEQFIKLRGSDELCARTEDVIFKSLVEWLEHKKFEREQHKEELLPLMKPLFLYDNVKSLCTTTDSHQVYVDLEWQSIPERQGTLNATKSTKRSAQFLMAIKEENNKTCIMYHCPQRLKWMNLLEGLDYYDLHGVAVMEDQLFILGGLNDAGVTKGVLCLNLETMTLKDVSPMKKNRDGAAAAELNGFLYAVGGCSGSNYLRTAEKLNPKTDTWSLVASMSVQRFSPGIIAFNEKLYVIGGIKSMQSPLSSAEYYDPQLNVWTSIASMNIPHKSPGVAIADGMLYAMGGIGEKTVERYDPVSNKWTKIFCLSDGIDGDLCTTFGDKVILLYKDRVEEYNPVTNECKMNASINGFTAVHLFSY